MINLRELLLKGHAKLAEKKAEKEKALAGKFRVGSVGCVTTAGQIYGVCHRISHLRHLGIETAPTLPVEIMWSAGVAYETIWQNALSAAGVTVFVDEGFEREDIAGHTDLEIEVDGERCILELKGIFGYSTLQSVYFEKRPKNENLIQAAKYSIERGLPAILCYINPNYVGVPFYDQKKYNEKTVLPFYHLFYLRWDGDVLQYRYEENEAWVTTVVTRQGIEDYYKLLAEMATVKDLGPRLNANYIDGVEHKFGSESGCKYCEHADACSKWDMNKDYDEWLNICKEIK